MGPGVDDIARWVKKTRDATFIEKDKDGYTVNRLETIGWTGGCTDTNELNFLAVKTMRSMGSAISKRRPGFDTVRRSPVWGPPSDAAR